MVETQPSADPETDWRGLAERAIGAGLETLESRTSDGLRIAPLYPRAKDDPPQPWRTAPAWSVAQHVDHPDPEAANRLALLDLEGGADALVLVDAASPFSRGFGGALAAGDLDLRLAGIELDRIGLRLDAGPATPEAAAALADLVARRRLTSAALAIDLALDPIGWRARRGRPCAADVRSMMDLRAKAGLAGTLFLADGRPYHEAGAGEAQELAAVLATAVAYLRQGEALGLSLDPARDMIALLLPVDADTFLGLAKVRAMRRLWARVETACGLTPKPVRLHAETSWRMMTRYDPWTNVMRATGATAAAGLGGADTIAVLPFTLATGLPDAASRRLARNVQRVLLDEAHLAEVADPAAGAGAVETLTDDVARESWRLFQLIESEGGIERSLDEGRLQARIAETATRRAGNIANLGHGIVGTSRFASLAAPSMAVLDVRQQPEPDAAGAAALPVRRDAAPFEALRQMAEAIAVAGARPRVFLATLGPPAAFGPRATRAINFFAAAGLAAEVGLAERSVADLVAAFKADGAPVACLCGTDRAYIESATELVPALRRAGARRVLLVGRPGEVGGQKDGIDAFIHDGCNALQVLAETLDSLRQT